MATFVVIRPSLSTNSVCSWSRLNGDPLQGGSTTLASFGIGEVRGVAVDGAFPVAVHRIRQDDVLRTEISALAIDLRFAIGDGLTREIIVEIVQVVADQHDHAIT